MLSPKTLIHKVRAKLSRKIILKNHIKVFKKYQSFTMIGLSAYIANLDLALSIREIKGAIVECGTWKGGMIAGIADALDQDRCYFLYDSFEGLPPAQEIDGASAIAWQKNIGSPNFHNNCSASYLDAKNAMEMSSAKNVRIIKGWFHETLVSSALPEKIALLRLDGDWYDSTLTCLTYLFPLVAKNGLVIIDDYYSWDGCSRAVHDYLSANSRVERIDKLNNVCFLRKTDD